VGQTSRFGLSPHIEQGSRAVECYRRERGNTTKKLRVTWIRHVAFASARSARVSNPAARRSLIPAPRSRRRYRTLRWPTSLLDVSPRHRFNVLQLLTAGAFEWTGCDQSRDEGGVGSPVLGVPKHQRDTESGGTSVGLGSCAASLDERSGRMGNVEWGVGNEKTSTFPIPHSRFPILLNPGMTGWDRRGQVNANQVTDP
jgi:hypothetical protein